MTDECPGYVGIADHDTTHETVIIVRSRNCPIGTCTGTTGSDVIAAFGTSLSSVAVMAVSRQYPTVVKRRSSNVVEFLPNSAAIPSTLSKRLARSELAAPWRL